MFFPTYLIRFHFTDLNQQIDIQGNNQRCLDPDALPAPAVRAGDRRKRGGPYLPVGFVGPPTQVRIVVVVHGLHFGRSVILPTSFGAHLAALN